MAPSEGGDKGDGGDGAVDPAVDPADRDLRTEFLLADSERRRELAEDPANEAMLRELLGADGLDALRSLPRVDEGHLSAKPAPNTLLVPGVMGSVLSPLGLGGVWWLDVRARNQLDRLGLNADGSDDAEPGIDVQPTSVDYSYTECMAFGLAHAHVSMRQCPYDWRRRLDDNVDRVVVAVDRLQAANGGQPVNLIGHSMGGLMIRTALMRRPELWDRVGRIVYIGTPHFGSTSIAGYLKGHLWGTEAIAVLGLYLSRATFQTLTGPLSLLPAPAGVYPDSATGPGGDHPCANFDLYAVDDYELDFGPGAAGGEARAALQARLDEVAEHWNRLTDAYFAQNADQVARQLMIVGVGEETLFRLERDGAWFGLKDKKHRDRVPGNRHREGDGRVPQASAELPGLTTRYVRGEHGGLPNIEAVAQTAFDWVTGSDGWSQRLATTAEGALGGTLADAGEAPAASPLRSASASGLYADGRLLDELTDAERQALIARVESGALARFELTKIL